MYIELQPTRQAATMKTPPFMVRSHLQGQQDKVSKNFRNCMGQSHDLGC